MTAKDNARNDAKCRRIIDVCVASLDDARRPVLGPLRVEGVAPDNIARFEREPSVDSLARLLNYHFHDETFAVIRKAGTVTLVRAASGAELRRLTLLELPE